MDDFDLIQCEELEEVYSDVELTESEEITERNSN